MKSNLLHHPNHYKMKLQIHTINIYLVIFIIFISKINSLQAQENDFGSWTGIKLSKKLTSNLTASFEEEIRFKENLSQLDNFYSEAGVAYKINNALKISTDYRFNQKQRSDHSLSKRHRINLALAFEQKIKAIELNYRIKGQSEISDYYSSENGKLIENTLRHKFSLNYDFNKRMSPTVATELFYPINVVSKNVCKKVRFIAGVKYEINKVNQIEINYLLDRERFTNNSRSDYVLQLGYHFQF